MDRNEILAIVLFAGIILFDSPVLSQYNAHVIQYDTEVEYADNTLTTTRSYTIQINDRESSWIAEVEIPWKEGQKLDIHEAIITDLEGNELRKIKKKEILSSSTFDGTSFYTDLFVKEFDLKWNTYPYRIKYSYTSSTSSYIDLAYWNPYYHSRIPVNQAHLIVRVPENLECRVEHSEEIEFVEGREEGVRIYRFDVRKLEAQDNEIFTPPLRERAAYARVIPEKFNYGVPGETDSWESFGNWMSDLNRNTDELVESEKIRVNELTAGIEDPREKVRVLYHHMQDHTRYVNISLDIGGMKSYSAYYVCKNGYGDCKALTTYMKALLKEAGIPSYYALVYAGQNPVRILRDQPGQQFNHVILAVPLKEDTLWLENTSSILPFNYLGTFTQDRYALLVDGNNSHLVRTPALEMEDIKTTRHYEFNLTSIGTGSASVRLEAKGDPFEEIRTIAHHGNTRESENAIRKLSGINDFDLKQWKIEDPERDQTSLTVRLDGRVKQQFRVLGDRKVLTPIKLTIPDFEEPEDRKHVVRIHLPMYQCDSISYNLMDLGSYSVSLPQPQELSSPYGYYLSEASLDQGNLTFVRYFRIHKGDYSTEEYPEFYAFLEQVRQAEKKTSLILTPQ